MAEKLGIFNQWMGGEWADRAAINSTAEDLSNVEHDLTALRVVVKQQSQELLRLRAMFMGVVEVLHAKAPFDDAELERAVEAAWTRLNPPPAPPPAVDAHTAELAAAKALLSAAQDHQFHKRFAEARATYQQVVDNHGDTKQAAVARQQLENLRKA